ncbi:hypothetical protein I548_3981 [Mycobacterium intracellulare]|nr:hypothetical protein I548_3981 [Mycobacterium intracellulare]
MVLGGQTLVRSRVVVVANSGDHRMRAADAGGPEPADSERDGPDPTTAASNTTMAAIAMTGGDRRGLVPSLNHTMIRF